MKRAVSNNNPFQKLAKFPFSGHVFLWELLTEYQKERKSKPYHLDYGAYNGYMLKVLSENNTIEKGVGLELNKEVVLANQNQLPSNVELMFIEKNPKLPYPDNTFDSISIMGVIEHIHDQHYILNELRRILKPDGVFVAAVPGQHFFSFLDFGNFKFRFPKLHRFYYETRFSKEAYNDKFIECKNGLIGDIEKEKAWHQHFTHQELDQLLAECGLIVTEKDGFGFFFRLLHNIDYFMPGFIKKLLSYFIYWDAKRFHSAEIFIKATKR